MSKIFFTISFLLLFNCNSSKITIEKKYYDSGELKQEAQKFKKQYHGITNEYSKNGNLKYIWNYKFNKLVGETTEFHLDGTKSVWIYDQNTLLSRKTFSKNNVLFQSFDYLADMRHGKAFQFYDSGEIEITWVFEKDKATEGKTYYKNGIIKNNFEYFDGVIANGISLEFYESGETRYNWNYLGGLLNGITKEYYKSGKLKYEWNYINGLLDGQSIYYDSASNVLNYIYYDNGKFIIQIKPN